MKKILMNYRLCLINPKVVNIQTLKSALKGFPIGFVISENVEDLKIIDTGMPVHKYEKEIRT